MPPKHSRKRRRKRDKTSSKQTKTSHEDSRLNSRWPQSNFSKMLIRSVFCSLVFMVACRMVSVDSQPPATNELTTTRSTKPARINNSARGVGLPELRAQPERSQQDGEFHSKSTNLTRDNNQLDHDLEARDRLLRELSSTMLLETLLFNRARSNRKSTPDVEHLLALPILSDEPQRRHSARDGQQLADGGGNKTLALLESGSTNRLSNSISDEKSAKEADLLRGDSFDHKSLNYLVDKMLSFGAPARSSAQISGPAARQPPLRPPKRTSPSSGLNSARPLTLDMLIKDEYDSRVQPMYEQLRNQQNLTLQTRGPTRRSTTASSRRHHLPNHRPDDSLVTSEATTTSMSAASVATSRHQTGSTTESAGARANSSIGAQDQPRADSDEYEDSLEDNSGDYEDKLASGLDDGDDEDDKTTASPTPKLRKILRNVPPYQLGSFTGRPATPGETTEQPPINTSPMTLDPYVTLPTHGAKNLRVSVRPPSGKRADRAPDASSRDSLVFSDGAAEHERKLNGNKTQVPMNANESLFESAGGGVERQIGGGNFLFNQLFSTMSPLIDLEMKLERPPPSGRDSLGVNELVANNNSLSYKGYVGRDDYLTSSTSGDWSRPLANSRHGSSGGISSTSRHAASTTTSTTPQPTTDSPTVPYNYYLNQPVTNAQSVPSMVIPTTPPGVISSRLPPVTLKPVEPPPTLHEVRPTMNSDQAAAHQHGDSSSSSSSSSRPVPKVTKHRKYSYQLPDNKDGNSKVTPVVAPTTPIHPTWQTTATTTTTASGNNTPTAGHNNSHGFWSPATTTMAARGESATTTMTPAGDRQRASNMLVVAGDGNSTVLLPMAGLDRSKQYGQSNNKGNNSREDASELSHGGTRTNSTSRDSDESRDEQHQADMSPPLVSTSRKNRPPNAYERDSDNGLELIKRRQPLKGRRNESGELGLNRFVNHEPAGSELTQTGLERFRDVTVGANETTNQSENQNQSVQHHLYGPFQVSGPNLMHLDNNSTRTTFAVDHQQADQMAPSFFGEASFERPVLDSSMLNTLVNPRLNTRLAQVDPHQRTSSNTVLSTVRQPVATTSSPVGPTSTTSPSPTTTSASTPSSSAPSSDVVTGGSTQTAGKSTNDRIAFILIGGSCVLSVVCLILAAMSMRCQDMCDDYQSLRNAERAALKLQKHRLKFTRSHQTVGKMQRGLGSSGSGTNLIDDFNFENNSDLSNVVNLQPTSTRTNPKGRQQQQPHHHQTHTKSSIVQFDQPAWAHQEQHQMPAASHQGGLAFDSGLQQLCACANCAGRSAARLIAHDDHHLAQGAKQTNQNSMLMHPAHAYQVQQNPMRFRPLFGAASSVSTFLPQGSRSKSNLMKRTKTGSTPHNQREYNLNQHAQACSCTHHNVSGPSNEQDHATHHNHCLNHHCHHNHHNHHNHHKCHHNHQHHQDHELSTTSDESVTSLDDANCETHQQHNHTHNHHHQCRHHNHNHNQSQSQAARQQAADLSQTRVKLVQMAKLNSQLSAGLKRQQQQSSVAASGQPKLHSQQHQMTTSSGDSSSLVQCTCQPAASNQSRPHRSQQQVLRRESIPSKHHHNHHHQAKRDKSMLIWSVNRDRLI